MKTSYTIVFNSNIEDSTTVLANTESPDFMENHGAIRSAVESKVGANHPDTWDAYNYFGDWETSSEI